MSMANIKAIVEKLGKDGSSAKAVIEQYKKDFPNEVLSEKTITQYTATSRKDLGFTTPKTKNTENTNFSQVNLTEAINFLKENKEIKVDKLMTILNSLQEVKNISKLTQAIKFLQENSMGLQCLIPENQ